jgi:hypothetical protein
MASVRMTNELRHDIRRRAEEAYDLANPPPKPNNEYVAAVRAAVTNSPEQTYLRDIKKLGEEREVNASTRYGQNILPHTPRESVTGIDLRIKTLAGVVDHSPNRDFKSCNVKFDTPLTNYLVVDGDRHRWGDPTVWINDLRVEDKTQLIEYFDAHQKADEDYTVARRNYESSIHDLVNNVTTLKQLLEIWPAAESLIPNDKIQKMHAKVTRAQRAAAIKEEVCFDPTIANQAVLTAKMLGG